MSHNNLRNHWRSFAIALLLLCAIASPAFGQGSIVISQVYGGGGATTGSPSYHDDYVELFNPGNEPVTMDGWSVQYASSAGSFTNIHKLPTLTIAPGQYLLIGELAGASAIGPTLPVTPDATGSLALSASAGKVALVRSQTGASSCADANIVDLVGYGSATCSAGTISPAGALTNIKAVVRKTAGCTNTGVNSADFDVVTNPVPRNSQTTQHFCQAATNPTGIGTATPTSVDPGSTVDLTVTTSPGSNPASTGITVKADLRAFGGSAEQAFAGSGNIFSYTLTVPANTTPGAKSINATVADAQGRSSIATIAFTVNPPPPPTVAIHDVQGTTGTSPYAGQMISVQGIVTAIRYNNGFFLQARDSENDADPRTPEAIFVFTSSAPPAPVAVGNELLVSGLISEYQPSGSRLTMTEVAAPLTYKLISTGNALPAPVTITAEMTNPAGPADQLQRFEAMRVHFDSLTSISGTGGTLTEKNATSSSNGLFYAVVTGVPRPFRTPGIDISSPLIAAGLVPAATPVFDGNIERLRVDSDGQVGVKTKMDVTSNTIIANIEGVLDYGGDAYTLLPDATSTPTISGGMTAQPVPAKGDRQLTVASFNLERFYNDQADEGGATNLTAAAFQMRVNKAALAIRDVLNLPDVIGLVEMENQATLDVLAAAVNKAAVDAGLPDPQYTGCTFQGNDPSAIDVAALVKTSRASYSCEQVGKSDEFTTPDGVLHGLHDRPPLVVSAIVTPPKGQPYPITVIVNHIKSLIGNEDTDDNGVRVRLKRVKQAEAIAKLIAQHQAAGEDVVSVGDYNAYEFSDGIDDIIGTVRGVPAAAGTVVQPSDDVIDPDLTDLIDTASNQDNYTYVETGNAQAIDHIIVTNSLLARPYQIHVAHLDADFPEAWRGIAARPERVSDHDAPVAYFTFPPLKADLGVAIATTADPLVTGVPAQYSFTVSNNGPDAAENVLLTASIPTGVAFNYTAPAGWTCSTSTTALSCTAEALAASAQSTFYVTITPQCAMATGTQLTTNISVSSDILDLATSNNSASQTWTASNPVPVISAITLTQSSLWPVNHKMVNIGLSYNVTDNCGVVNRSVAITSNQLGANGSGNTAVDWQVVDANHVQLRAERSGNSGDRVYTITVSATDEAGQTSTRNATVLVPHNQ